MKWFKDSDSTGKGCMIFWLIWIGVIVYSSLHPKSEPPEPSAAQILAGKVAGDWEAIGGTINLTLNDHDAVFSKDVTVGKTIESRGTWSASDHTIQVHANGAVGRFDLTMEYTPGVEVDVLSPVPKSSAIVTNCYFRKAEPDNSE